MKVMLKRQNPKVIFVAVLAMTLFFGPFVSAAQEHLGLCEAFLEDISSPLGSLHWPRNLLPKIDSLFKVSTQDDKSAAFARLKQYEENDSPEFEKGQLAII